MNKFKDILNKLKAPNVVFAVFYSIGALALIAVTLILLILGYSEALFMYVLYVLSAIALTYLVYLIVYYAPKIKNSIINALKKHKFTNELLESYGYRSVIFATFSFIINIVYAVFQGVFAILSHSVWYGALAVYYIVISCIRGGIVAISRHRSKNQEYPLENQVKSYRNCGIYLVVLNFALVGAIVQMVLSDQSFKYAGLMIYAMAVYAFYKLGMGIYNLIKAKKHNDYTIQSIKNISFADALVSILALQTALLSAFSPEYRPYLPNSLTGGAVSLAIIAIGFIMIVKGHKKLKQLRKEKIDERKIQI